MEQVLQQLQQMQAAMTQAEERARRSNEVLSSRLQEQEQKTTASVNAMEEMTRKHAADLKAASEAKKESGESFRNAFVQKWAPDAWDGSHEKWHDWAVKFRAYMNS